MISQDISSQGNMDIRIFVLEGETVDSLLHAYIERASQSLDETQLLMLKKLITRLTIQISLVSPSDVSQSNLVTLVEDVKLLMLALDNNQYSVDDFFNTLNLCVVGLGTKLRGVCNE
jgi:hypothetical protein